MGGRRLRCLAFVLVVLASIWCSNTPVAWGQEVRSHGYLFGGVSHSGATLFHVGGGGEAVVYRGLAVGGELGYLAPFTECCPGLGVLSANGSYQFSVNSDRIVPFATGGYSFFFNYFTANLFNFGVGVHIWTSDSRGLRFEYRDHVWPDGELEHFQGVRVGFEFN